MAWLSAVLLPSRLPDSYPRVNKDRLNRRSEARRGLCSIGQFHLDRPNAETMKYTALRVARGFLRIAVRICRKSVDSVGTMDVNGDARALTAEGVPASALVDILRRSHRLDISCYSDAFLSDSFGRRCRATAGMTPARYFEHLSRDGSEAETFVRFLRIHHSEFFRDPFAFTLLEQRLLPSLASAKAASDYPELRVWSAGCAAGEEAYSIAILLRELCDEHVPQVRFRIFATDSSEEQLAMACAGAYSPTALGNVNLRHLGRWFSRRDDDTYVVVPELRERVDFSIHDLCDERISSPSASIFGEFDLIFCCNILFYFRPECQARVLDRLRRCLVPGGFLVTGDAEREITQAAGFRSLNLPAAIFQGSR